jgi:hypothetical protein
MDVCGMTYDDAALIVRLHNELYIALCGMEMANVLVEKGLKSAMVIQFSPSMLAQGNAARDDEFVCKVKNFEPSGLSEIFRFNAMVANLSKLHPGLKLVFCAEQDVQSQVQLAFLIGCHMIMTHGLGFEEAYLAFRPLYKLFERTSSDEMSVEKSMRAFCCAKCLNWIDYGQHIDSSIPDHPICMDESDHYSRYFTSCPFLPRSCH